MLSLPTTASPLEFERKFLISRQAQPAAAAVLGTVCRPARDHPENEVLTTYYDTLELASLCDKLDSQRFKSKVRLRWYEDPGGGRPLGPGFLEVKYRLGAQRRKLRMKSTLRGSFLARAPLFDRRIERAPEALRELEVVPPAGLRPVLTVAYRRSRFVEPASGSRVALDSEIRVARVNPRLLATAPRLPLRWTILEVKNRSGELPPILRTLVTMRALRSSFSKYLACYERAVAGQALAG